MDPAVDPGRPAPEGFPEWAEGRWERWAEEWAGRLPREVRAYGTVPPETLRAQVMDHARALRYMWRDGGSDPLRDFYAGLARDGHDRGLGLPDLVAGLFLGRGLLRGMAAGDRGDASPWDGPIGDVFEGALTLLLRQHEEAVAEAVRREMEASEGQFLAILRSSADGLAVVDPEGRVALWNRGASELLGVAPEEAVGRPLASCIPPELIRETPAASSQGGTRHFEARVPSLRGGARDLLVTRTEVPGGGEGAGWASLVLKDVTEVKELQRELAHAEHLAGLGRLSASVAHEIKNPIAGLRGAMEVISQVHRPDDPRFVIFQEALAQIRRLDSLVKDLLAYAKPVNLNLEPVPVSYLVEAALPLVRDQLKEARAELRVEIPEGLPRVLADPQHLPQVFSNLLQNGAQAMEGGGPLEVTAEASGGEVVTRVRDAGCGISREAQAKIFQPFYTTKHIGTGLGLSIVQRILLAHGGRCEVSSEPGEGSVFSVVLLAEGGRGGKGGGPGDVPVSAEDGPGAHSGGGA